jgi:hypothetical protein
MRKDSTILRHVSSCAPQLDSVYRSRVASVDFDRAAIGIEKSIDGSEKSCFTGSTFSDERQTFRWCDGKTHMIERHYVAVTLGYVDYLD